ncbi:hypothetical protein [Clostridium sp. 'White wine YQ']|uniref:hypothetical protein n=1 Tax=Clostridium sp. 'White wine YQ' TaxID=3027474 RepID=UPI002365C35C|nr:hypothetical protein [Clostridium sp. 'White wine YQ']MDD7793477.1 hypothetical protein [Clostridium sp. 'White wine YQ']
MFEEGFPDDLRDDVLLVVKLIPFKTFSDISIVTSADYIQYFQEGRLIKFPHRIYFIDLDSECMDKLTLQQQMILHCIYTRSCDGYVRQKHLRALLEKEYEEWTIPYIVKLCDEYVVQIIEMTYDILKLQNTEKIKKFCWENRQAFSSSYDRMTSYWNEYYRYEYNYFSDYIGRKLFIECFGYSKSVKKAIK